MKKNVMLSICGRQNYEDQEPDVIELVTEGILEERNGIWYVSYEESDMTGLRGVTTTFQIDGKKIVLDRAGKLTSRMEFCEGVSHDSLYQIEFGALMITVFPTKVESNISEHGGTIDLVYNIEVEHSAAGVVEYHLGIKVR